jgi:hypothetical protein
MRLSSTLRIAACVVALLFSALALSADYPGPCDCASCKNASPEQTCSTNDGWTFTVWACVNYYQQNCTNPQSCEEVTACQSNADCFGGACTRSGICLCPGT